MSCEVCFEPFDHSNRKPYSLSSCPHTYCAICLDHLTNSKCPQCSKPIVGKNLNIALLKFIPKSEYDDLKEDTLKNLIEINESKQAIKYERQEKLNMQEIKLTSIRQAILYETTRKIKILKENKKMLLDECDLMLNEIKTNFDSNKFEYNSLFFITYSKESIETNELNKDELQSLNNQIIEIKQKLIELSVKNRREINYEFILNKTSDSSLEVGELKTVI